jgi:hypothetical protein
MSKVGVKKALADIGYCSECGKKGKITIRERKPYCGGCAPPSTWVPPVIPKDPDKTRFGIKGERGDGKG